MAGADKQDGATYKFNNVSYGLDATLQAPPNVQLDRENSCSQLMLRIQVGLKRFNHR